MITLERAKNMDIPRVYLLYLRAFPASERKPFSKIRSMYRQGRADVWCIMESGKLLGLATTVNSEKLILLDEERTAIDPLVYVKPTDTAVWERGCGSGSAAVACYLTVRRGAAQCLSIRQRGGTIAAVTAWNGQCVTQLHITGSVALMGEKETDVVF